LLNIGLIDMKCTVKGNKITSNICTSYCLIEVVTIAGLTVYR